MVHKIWDRETSEKESGTIRDHLADCYEKLYVVSDEQEEDPDRAADLTAENLIK